LAEEATEYQKTPPKQLAAGIERQEKEMLEHARNHEFEEAALLRDRVE